MDDLLNEQIQKSINEFKNRVIYQELSPEIIVHIPDEKLEMAIVDFVLEKHAREGGTELDVLAKLPEVVRASYLTFCLEGDVDNGGFNQYFWNFSKQHAVEAEKGFRLIGANDFAEVVKKAIAVFEQEESWLSSFIEEHTLQSFSDSYKNNPLNEIDTLFHSLNRTTSQKRIAFIRNNSEQF